MIGIRPKRYDETRIDYIREQKEKGFNNQEIAQELDVTRERVRQIIIKYSTEPKYLKQRYLKDKKFLLHAHKIMNNAQKVMDFAIQRITNEDFVKFVNYETNGKYTKEQIKQLLIDGETLDGIVE